LWLLDARGQLRDRQEIMFIDARQLGTMTDRTERVLTGADIAAIAGAYHAWRQAEDFGAASANVPGFCRPVPLAEIRQHEHVLTPGRYVGAPDSANAEDEPVADRVERLTKELLACFEESARLGQAVRDQIEIARNTSESTRRLF
jgi:type I restriction enzyme M protein